jgi:hypothetical protein
MTVLPAHETDTYVIRPLDTPTERLFVAMPATARLDVDDQLRHYQPVGVDQLNRLAAGETLVLPLGAAPAPARPAMPTTYGEPAIVEGCDCCAHEQKPVLGRGRRRRPWPRISPWWALAAFVAGGATVWAGVIFSAAAVIW